ncbi:hypothetical protein GCM10007385_05930 [Tateyamaria omphalii]|uniref:beta strand repeat-containing protein n=1 Tax=Tateyamaria omphalii TaxID=299262 RepID=UPI00167702E8|nr:DUF11 domain-containing protein [Tateyamaria omphalii]GGX41224.1 hypothetical protein GCM10007385_05930 [Tateyamaria omphalii]
MKTLSRALHWALAMACVSFLAAFPAHSTPFTTNVPGTSIALPGAYPEAGGVAIVMEGVNGQIYYQFSDPNGAFRGFNSNGQPTRFRGNPFTVNDPIPLDCGIRSCTDYFGGAIARVHVRFSAFDGDTQPGGFDENDISLILNGVNVGSWSGLTTERTNNSGTVSQGFQTGFGNNSFNTGWFTSTNPTLLNSLLTTGQTTTQVLDDDPNDNFWDFRRGQSLSDEALRTIAPGYEFEKTTTATDYTAVGDVITYTYTVTNIGSVNINNLTVFDDKVDEQGGTVSCDRTTINETTGGGAPQVATCTATYTVTQDDIDNESLTNIARANGDPEFGQLGEVQDTVTLPGPTASADMTLTKVARETAFSVVGEVITYDYTLENTGNTTLTNLSVSDNRIPALSCAQATLLPTETLTCTGTYTVTQADLDDFAQNGTPLTNTATANAQDRGQSTLTRSVDETVDGPAAAPALVVSKTALQQDFDSDDDVLQFRIEVTNTGNVTWPGPPTITDALITDAGGTVSCPAGAIPPNGAVICTADYAVEQADLNAGEVLNEVTASITVGGVAASASGSVTVPAVQTTGLTLVKQLNATSATSFDAAGVTLVYDYVLTNTGNVTLTSPRITDDKVSATCTATEILPGTSVTCTSDDYITLQEDVDLGSVTNIATAAADDPDAAEVLSDQAQVTVDADQMPELTLDKLAPVIPAVDFFEGQTVTYTYEIENTGNTTITAPLTVNDDRFPDPIDCGTGDLLIGETRTCQAVYTITAADESLGFVSNTATATDGTTTSNSDTETVPQAGTDAIELTKTADLASVSSTSDVITYTFTVTNVGDRTIGVNRTISINDPRLSSVTCVQTGRIFPVGQGTPNSVTCTGTTTPTQAEIDAGEVVNTATAQFTRNNGGNPFDVVSPSAEATVPVGITPSFTLDKIGPSQFSSVGEILTYTFRVTNDTEQTIASATVTDPLIPGLVCDLTNIGPLAFQECTGAYTVTQADLDRETITNIATVNGMSSTGDTIDPSSDTEVTPVDPASATRAVNLSKTANVTEFSAVGDEIRYSFAVANTGTQTLTDIVVTDPLVSLTCTIPTLAPSTTDTTTCQAIYPVTQTDLDNGQVNNIASVAAPGTTGDSSSLTVPAIGRNADFTVEKQADDAVNVIAGQVITYSYRVRNTGNVTLTNVSLTDDHTSASGTQALTISGGGDTGNIAPGAEVTLTSTYTVTQDDIDAGADLTNIVSGTAVPPSGLTPPTDSDTETVTVAAANPALRVVKTEVDGSGTFGAVTSAEAYTFEVFNDGNVTLSNLSLSDDLTGFSCTLADLLPGASTTTCADTTPLADSYTITQTDVDARFLTNEVEVTGTAPGGASISDTDTITLAGPTQAPSIDMTKTATAGDNFTAVGDVVSYDYVVSNTGNITLTADITVADDRTTVSCPALPLGGLAPGSTLTCTATYQITQDDLDAGSVLNRATATITQTVVPDTPGGPTEITTSSPEQTETVTAAQSPALSVSKALAASSASSFTNPGDTLTYAYTVTNTGNVTITDTINVTDNQIAGGAPQLCSEDDLAPGASLTCELIWTADQPAIDAGSITNIASPQSTFGGVPVPSTSDTLTVPAVQTPALTMLKEFVSIQNANPPPAAGDFAAGNDVIYRYTVTNSGNTTITAEPVVTDNLISAAFISIDAPFPAAGLAPGDSVIYTGVYELTLADIQLGSVTNNATATSGGVTSNPATETIPTGANPALSITKTAIEANFTAVGDVINYEYVVENTSQGSPAPAFANAITVDDDRTTVTCPAVPGGQLLVGQSITCEAEYVVTQADLDAVAAGQPGGFVTNVATANTVFAGQPVQSPAATVTVPAVNDPALSVVKSVSAGPDPAGEGDTITFAILTTNSGDTTVSGIDVSDPLLASLSCFDGGANTDPAATLPATLAPGAQLLCEGDYTVTQEDVDDQSLVNTATAQGVTPNGDPVVATGSVTAPLEDDAPAVEVTKALSASEPDSSFSVVGQEIEFTVTVRNTGNVTLTSTTVTDDLVPGETCSVPGLAPGEEDQSCTFLYTVTQADVDQGDFTNVARASSVPISDPTNPVTDDGPLLVDGPDAEPSFSLVKDADITSFAAPGVTITYSYTVSNTGNVTLTAEPTVSDDRIASVSCPAFPTGGLAPLDSIVCTATYETTQDDVDAGEVTNIASVASSEVPFDPTDPNRAEATETVPATRGPAFTIDKTVDDATDVQADQELTYSYLVTNTGNVTLTDVTLTDSHTSAAGTSPLTLSGGGVIATLDPGESVTLTATYTVTQADVDAGADLTNAVTGTATPPGGLTPPTADDTQSVSVEGPTPEVTALKTVSASTGTDVGDSVTFDITVSNTGNVTLDTVTLTDTLRDGNGQTILPAPVPALIAGDGVTLNVDETWTYQVTHVLTQSDIDSGGLSNSVLVQAQDPSDTPVSDLSDNGVPGDGSDNPTTFTVPPAPGVTGIKTITSTGTAVGDTVSFLIEIENTGNVTLTDVDVTSDTLERQDGTSLTLATGPIFSSNDDGSPAGTLQVGETATYTATYVLVQEDLDAGGIRNSAIVSGTPPTGPPTTDITDNGVPGDGDDTPTSLDIAAAPSFSFVKEYTGADASFDAVDDVLDYTFTLVNTGNVTLTDPIVITDPLLITPTICDPVSVAAPWAPDDTRTCTASYTVTQEDLDRGEVENTASAAVGSAPGQTDSVTVPASQSPAMELLKEAESVDPATEFFVGAVVDYTYTVTNTGNVTLTAPITVTDNLIPAADIICPTFPTDGIAPGGTYVCSASYTVTLGDVDLTSVTNLASASDGTTTSPQVTETIPNAATPALDVTKELVQITDATGATVRTGGFETVGDRLFYRFTVTNSGGLAFVNDVVVNDARLAAPLVCFSSTGADPDFRPGETVTCETDLLQSYEVTQEDLDAGEVFNEAIAETSASGLTAPVISDVSSVTTPAASDPMIELVKSTTATSFANVGDTITFDFVLSNTGNQTLTDVSVTDPLIPALVCEADTLAPGDDLTCSGDYLVTQEDVDNGTLSNTATAGAIDPTGTAVTPDTSSVTVPGPLTEPLSLALSKTATPTPFGAVGSTVSYGFEVENTSRFTLADVTVTDPLIPGFSCVIATLDPGATDTTSCAALYTVTQEDVDRGSIENTAQVTARDLLNTRTVTVEDTLTTAGPARTPALEVTKTADVLSVTPGSTITYTLRVENVGNVTVEVTGITDTMTRINTGAPTFLTTPFTFVTGDANNDDLLDVDEVWEYSATYVLSQSDVNAGGVSNTAAVTADGPAGTGTVSDTSDNGNDGDGNTTDDPTIVDITSNPRLDVTKTVVTTGSEAGDTVVFEIRAANTGNVDVSGLAVADTLSRANGEVIGTQPATPVGVIADPLAPGSLAVWRVSYTLTTEDVDAGGLSNVVVVSGMGPGPGNVPVSDVGDNGDDTDGNTTDDPTVLTILPMPELVVTKTSGNQTVEPTAPGETVTFDILIENLGNVTLRDLVFTDTLTRLDGTPLDPDTPPLAGFAELGAGENTTVSVAYTLTQEDFDAGGIQNIFAATGNDPLGLPVTDNSDDGDDTDGNVLDDPTLVPITAVPTVVLTKTANVPTRVSGSVFEVLFTIAVENTGNVTQADLVLTDDMTVFVTPSTLVNVGAPTASGFATGGANGAFDGQSDTNTLSAGTSLAPGETGTVTIVVQYDTAAGSPSGTNTASLTSDRIAAAVTASAAVASSEPTSDIVATKRATNSGILQRGSVVTFELTFENRNTTAESGLTFVDQLPPGLLFLPGSATFNGASTPEPVMNGRSVTWPGQTLAPSEVVMIRLSARLTGGPGEYINSAYALGPTGARVSNTATAAIRVTPEAVFDCGDIIGKVFDDVNGDGYQDPPEALKRSANSYAVQRALEKLTPAEIKADGGEPGLPGVKLVTPRGDIITTDKYGRFNVPCALLPDGSIGSNFQLKLDDRTLPTGYRVTTENPRVIRVTAGKLAELNFGARLGNLVEIDLTAAAFAGNGPNAALIKGLQALVEQIRQEPSAIQLRYYRADESVETARARLRTAEEALRKAWRGRGTYRLDVDRSVRRLQ